MAKPKATARNRAKPSPKRKRGNGKPKPPALPPMVEAAAAIADQFDRFDVPPILASISDERPRGRFRRAWKFFFGERA